MDLYTLELETIQKWADKNAQGKVYTYLKTLKKSYPQVKTWGEILDMNLSGKKIKDLSSAIINDYESIITTPSVDEVVDSVPTPSRICLPAAYDDSESFNSLLNKFIADYYAHLKTLKDSDKKTRKVEAFRMAFLDDGNNSKPLSNKSIAQNIIDLYDVNIDSERVRQLKKAFAEKCAEVLRNKSKVFETCKPLLYAFDSLFNMAPAQIKVSIEGGEFGIKEPRTKEFLMAVLEVKQAQRKGYDRVVVEKSDSLSNLLVSLGPLKKYLKKKIVVNIDELLTFIRESEKISVEAKDLISFIKNTPEFEVIQGLHDSVLVSLKWDKINSVDAQCARILYDNAIAKGDKAATMHIDDISSEYSRRAMQYGLEKSVNKTSVKHCQILSLGNGNYAYNFGQYVESADKKETSKKKILKFMANNPTASVEDLRQYCASDNINLSDTSIEQYRSSAIRQLNGGVKKISEAADPVKVLQTLANVLSQSSTPMPFDELMQKYDNVAEILDVKHPASHCQSLVKSMKRAPQVFLLDYEKKTAQLLLSKEALEAYDFSKHRKNAQRVALKTRPLICERAIELLLSAKDHQMRKGDLVNGVKDLWLEATSKVWIKSAPNIYPIFDANPMFIVIGEGKGSMYKLNEELYRKEHEEANTEKLTDKVETKDIEYSWESLKDALLLFLEDLVIDDLSGSLDQMRRIMFKFDRAVGEYEKTLKLAHLVLYKKSTEPEKEYLYYKLIFGVEQYLKNYGKYYYPSNGLANIISELQARGILPNRYESYEQGSVEEQVQRLTGVIIKERNIVAHQNRIRENLKGLFSFYVLVATLSLA